MSWPPAEALIDGAVVPIRRRPGRAPSSCKASGLFQCGSAGICSVFAAAATALVTPHPIAATSHFGSQRVFLLFWPRTRGRSSQGPRSTTLARSLSAHYQSAEIRMVNARDLFERVLDGIDSSLSARLILVRGAAADANPTDMYLALGHDRQSASESNDSGNQRKSWYHAPFEILAVSQFLNAASGKRKSC
jgi:hypothetical protein